MRQNPQVREIVCLQALYGTCEGAWTSDMRGQSERGELRNQPFLSVAAILRCPTRIASLDTFYSLLSQQNGLVRAVVCVAGYSQVVRSHIIVWRLRDPVFPGEAFLDGAVHP
jgi:hypothetical protein